MITIAAGAALNIAGWIVFIGTGGLLLPVLLWVGGLLAMLLPEPG